MRALVQRVSEAAVTVAGEVTGGIGKGLCVLVAVTHDDTPAKAQKLARLLWGLRIFDDEAGVPNLSASDLGLEVLVVSQFTLYADTSRGRRPSYGAAASPDQAEPLIDRLVEALRTEGATVATGRFRAHMQVHLINDGPFTVTVDA